MDNAETAFDLRFGWEPLAALAAELVEKSCCSLQSLLPDGFARHITESELLLNSSPLFSSQMRKQPQCRATYREPVYKAEPDGVEETFANIDAPASSPRLIKQFDRQQNCPAHNLKTMLRHFVHRIGVSVMKFTH